jgi:hypothetical protein
MLNSSNPIFALALQDRVDIPQEEHPEINFIGILIGPRGNTLKKMEAESGAKIMVRAVEGVGSALGIEGLWQRVSERTWIAGEGNGGLGVAWALANGFWILQYLLEMGTWPSRRLYVLLSNALFAILPQIRGKGSVKPGRGRKDGMPIPGEDEPMHALVTGPDEVRCLGCVAHVCD